MLLMLGILSMSLGWLLLYAGYAGISVRQEIGHIFSPTKTAAPRPTNPGA